MSNAAIASGADNLADVASWTASSSQVLSPVTYVQDPQISRHWISLTSSAFIVADLEEPMEFDTIGVMGIVGTSLRIRLSSTTAGSAAGDLGDFTIAVDQDYLQVFKLLDAAVEAHYVRLDLSAASGAVEIGRVFIGSRTVFDYNYGFNWSYRWVDPSIRSQTPGGQTRVFPKRKYRTIELNFEWVSPDQRYDIVETVDRDCGLSEDILLCTDPASSNLARDTLWGLASEVTPIVQPFPELFSKVYRIDQRL